MSQYGMQMPGGQLQRGPAMNVYTGLLAFAAVALVGACAMVYFAATSIAPGGNPFQMHAYDSAKKSYTIDLPDK